MRRLIRRTLLLLAAFAFIGGLYFWGTIDAHQVNLRYILWKHHLWPHQRFMLPFLSVDGEFSLSLKGKTKAEIQRYFPVLIPPELAITEYQRSYNLEMVKHRRDYLWIGDSGYAVQFEDGKVVYVGPVKG
jgi:hypothetical protein